jgi:hypothetical protein
LTYLLRLVATVFFLGLLLTGAYLARPAELGEIGLDVWEWPAAAQQLDAAEQRGHDLDERMEGALHRHDERSRISRELIAGRISLDDAVHLTQELGGLPEHYLRFLRRSVAGATDEERLYRHVIDWACDYLENEPDRAAFRDRCRGEMAAHFHRPAAGAS